MDNIEISVIIPVYNEIDSIPRLLDELIDVLEKIGKKYEIIIVDDGSDDWNIEIFSNLAENHDWANVKVIWFRKNEGKSKALNAGFKEAKGGVIITLDGDLQDDPKEIPKFLEELDEGYDLVVGWKYDRKDSLAKKIPSVLFNWLTRRLTGIQAHDSNCCFKAYKKEVVKDINIYGELHRYIPSLVHWKGYKISEIKVNHRVRKYGKSKYGVGRLFNGFLDLLTVKFLMSYGDRPLHFFGKIGMLFLLFAICVSMPLLYWKLCGESVGNRPLLMLDVVLYLISFQFIALGLHGEMIVKNKK